MSGYSIEYPDRPAAPAEPAFREHASGLIVPTEISRQRIAVSRDDWKTVDRAVKILERLGLSLYFRCEEPACQKTPIREMRDVDGSFVLRCEHADRIYSRSY